MTSTTQYNILQHNNSAYIKRKLWIEEMEELEGNEQIYRTYILKIKNVTCLFTLEALAISQNKLLIGHILNIEYYLLPDILKNIINEILDDMITNSMFRYNIMMLEPGDSYICNQFEIKFDNEKTNDEISF